MILNLAIRGDIQLAYDTRIIDEYLDVLNRKEFGFDKTLVGMIIGYIFLNGISTTPAPLDLGLPDEDDEKFVEVACSAGAEFLITGNLKHYSKKAKGYISLVSPRDFIREYCGNSDG